MRRFLVSAVAVATLLTVAAPAAADLGSDLDEVSQQIDDLEATLASVEGRRTELASTIIETGRRLEAVAAELLAAQEELAQTVEAIAATEDRITLLEQNMDERRRVILRVRADADRERQAAMARAVDVYMSAHADAADVFAGADGSESGVGIVYADRVQSAADQVIAAYELHRFQEQQEVERLQAEQAEAEAEREDLTLRQMEREIMSIQIEARVAEVEQQLAEQKALLRRMEDEIAHFEGEIADLAREEDFIRALIAQEGSASGDAPSVLLRPVPGAVSSGFGWRIHPIYGDSRLHTGWDMNGGCGQPIVAAAPGRVFYAGWKGGYGNAVIIDHGGGMSTLYAHQSALGVSYDQWVTTGEVIGWVGTTGTSTACHLHWEVRLDGIPVDPSPYV